MKLIAAPEVANEALLRAGFQNMENASKEGPDVVYYRALTEFTTKCFERLASAQAFLEPYLCAAERIDGIYDWTGAGSCT